MAPAAVDRRAAAETIERAALERLRPSTAFLDRLAGARSALVAKAEHAAKISSIPLVRALVAGSAARGGFLTDRVDIDLFLLFPPDISRQSLTEFGLALGRSILPEHEMRYAEHPYLRGRFEGFRVDAVPGYAVADGSRPQSAVDRTPFHQAYLEARETPAIIDEIRLTKQFLRGLGVYGSEARTGGFSGYLVELLVLRYGSFRALLEATDGWGIPARLLSRPTAPPRVPDEVAMILDDPVDPERNVSSALTRRNLGIFLLAARAYRATPSAAAFEEAPTARWSRTDAARALGERGTHVVVLWLPRPDLVDDILFPQLRRAERGLRQAAERWGFQPYGSGVGVDETHVLVGVELAQDRLPRAQLRDGPPVDRDRAGSFLSKWAADGSGAVQGPYVRADGTLGVETFRERRTMEELVVAEFDQLPLGVELRGRRADVQCTGLGEAPEGAGLGDLLTELLGKELPFRRWGRVARPTG